jgi:hypothetical protein
MPILTFPESGSRREGHLEPKGLPLTPDVLRRQADLALLVVEPTVSGVHEWLACYRTLCTYKDLLNAVFILRNAKRAISN